jgi:hypothetical protein
MVYKEREPLQYAMLALEESAGSFEMLTKTYWSYNQQQRVAEFPDMQIRFIKGVVNVECSAVR